MVTTDQSQEQATAFRHMPPLVMVVDDEVNTTMMLQRIFEREGYQAVCVNESTTALQMARDILPDLILLDIRIPVINGFDVLRSLREDPVTASIPTILITANAREPADVSRGLDLGADDYLYKPFAPQELVARAQSKMRSRQLEEALQRRTDELAALLRVSEELNQHLEVNELLNLLVRLVASLLPCDMAAIYQIDEYGTIITYRAYSTHNGAYNEGAPHSNAEIVRELFVQHQAFIWTEALASVWGYASGVSVPLDHSSEPLGILLVMSQQTRYTENHLNLLNGIGRQAALALHNALLFQEKVNQTLRLEDMVEARARELKRAYELIARSEKLAATGRLAASIAHEINNPLQPIKLTLNDILEDVYNGATINVRDVQVIQESVDRIGHIVRQLLDFNRARDEDSDFQPLALTEILTSIIEFNHKFMEKSNVAVVVDLPPLPYVYGSRYQLEIVFMNLMLNARDAMKAGGTLAIRAHVHAHEVIIEVADTGCGIPADQLDKIFDPFYSTKPNGTGLGLFVTYGIIERHQGAIEVQSVVGKGTTFTLRLPVYVEP